MSINIYYRATNQATTALTGREEAVIMVAESSYLKLVLL